MAMNTTAILILAAGAAIIGGAIFLKPKEEDELPPPEVQQTLRTVGGLGLAGPGIVPPPAIVQVSAAPDLRKVVAL